MGGFWLGRPGVVLDAVQLAWTQPRSSRDHDGPVTEPVAQPYRFAGNYQDFKGFCDLQARYYDADIGRFTQPDPSGQAQNPCLCAEGDPVPVNGIDPSGLVDWSAYGDRCRRCGGCAIDVGLVVLSDYGGSQGGTAGEAIDYLMKAKEVIDIVEALL